jgi:hypothetical protein
MSMGGAPFEMGGAATKANGDPADRAGRPLKPGARRTRSRIVLSSQKYQVVGAARPPYCNEGLPAISVCLPGDSPARRWATRRPAARTGSSSDSERRIGLPL